MPTTNATNELKTLPMLSIDWRVGLDRLRQIVRESPKLKVLGTKFGATRVFDLKEQEQIRERLNGAAAKM